MGPRRRHHGRAPARSGKTRPGRVASFRLTRLHNGRWLKAASADNKSFQPEKKATTMQSLTRPPPNSSPLKSSSTSDEGWRIFVDTCPSRPPPASCSSPKALEPSRGRRREHRRPKEARREAQKELCRIQTRQARGARAATRAHKLTSRRDHVGLDKHARARLRESRTARQ